MSQTRVLDLGQNGVFHFETQEAVTQWVNDEMSKWQFAQPFQPVAAHTIRVILKGLRQRANVAFSTPGAWQDFEQDAIHLYLKFFHSTSTTGQFVLTLASDPEIASAALAHLLKQSVENSSNPKAQTGVMLARIFESGIFSASGIIDTVNAAKHDIGLFLAQAKQQLASEISLLTENRKSSAEFQTQIGKSLDAAREEQKVFQKTVAQQANDAIAAAGTGFSNSVASFNKAMGDLVQANTDHMKAIEDTYKAKLSVHAAVSYWETKRDLHCDRAFWWGLGFAASLLASAGLLILVLVAPWSDTPFLPTEVTWDKIPVNRIAIMALLVTGLFWATRTVARMFFSNLHLYTDADERVVMVTTYLALLKEEAALKPEDRGYIIQTLFRKATTGIVKEDANPPLLIQNLLNKGS